MFLAEKIGSGGGHTEKAGGLLKNELIKKVYPDFVEIDDDSAKFSISNIIRERLNDYFENSEIIYAKRAKLDAGTMTKYVKSPIVVGFVHPQKHIPSGNMAIVRTLKGDNNVEIRDNTVLIIGINGDVTAISEEKFASAYTTTGKRFKLNLDYTPTIKNADTGKLLPLTYMVGKKGDYIAVSVDDPHDIFIVEKSIFKKTYTPA